MKKALWIAPSILVVMASGGAYWLSMTARWRQAASGLARDVAIAKSLGIPFSTKDVASGSPIPTEENAAVLLLPATEAMKKALGTTEDPRQTVGLLYQKPLPYDELAKAMQPFQESMRLAALAAARTRCDFHRDFDFGPKFDIADLADDRYLVRLLCMRAEVSASKGKLQDCLTDLATAKAIIRDISQDAVLDSVQSAAGTEMLELRFVSRCITRFHGNVPALKALSGFLNEASPLPDVRAALRSEIYFGINTIRNLEAMGAEPSSDPNSDSHAPPAHPDLTSLQHSGLPGGLKERAYLARYLEFWNTTLKAGEKDSIADLSERIDSEITKLYSSTDPAQAVNKVILGTYLGVGRPVVMLDATRSITKDLAAVMLFQAQTGKYPPSLASLGLHDMDPYNGKPIQMTLFKNILRVYSVGEDLADDHGRFPFEARDVGGTDLIAAYPSQPMFSRRG